MHSRREHAKQKFNINTTQGFPLVVGGQGWGGRAPHLKIFFETPPPTKTNAPPTMEHPHPHPPLINEAPPSEKQTAPIET